MIDYDKLKIAHELGQLLCTQTGMRVDISLVFMDEDVPGYLFIDYRSDKTHLYEQIDVLINELTELTQPEPKYKEGDIVWTYGMTIQDWKIDSIYYEPDRNDFRVNLSHPNGKASVMQSQLYPTRQFLIEAQIDYWQNLLNEEKPTSSCCSAHAGSTDECKDEFQHEKICTAICCGKSWQFAKTDWSIAKCHLCGKNFKEECQHESEKLYMYSEYCANPPVFECKKCGEFYR